jgi:osmotically-inducible protein OsmY
MKSQVLIVCAHVTCVLLAFAQNSPDSLTRVSERIAKEIRHELLILPSVGVFDNITYKLDGYTVTLMGKVTRPTLKSDAENAVNTIEGLQHLDNQIEVFPQSPTDDRLRGELYRAIYDSEPLRKYAVVVNKPIRILVNDGYVLLEGVVDNEADRKPS